MSGQGRFAFIVLLLACHRISFAADPVFSGPQVGEKLPAFEAQGVFGDQTGKKFDLITQADGKPVLLIFFHARTRPAFGLTNTVMKYAAGRSKDGLAGGVVFLTDDPTATEKWMHVVEKHLPKGVTYGISNDGAEGPGAYGLNRNVTLTVLVGKEGRVTANFALIQPSLQADGPKILKAIVEATGGGKVPTIAELGGRRYAPDARKNTPDARKKNKRPGPNDPKLTSLLRAVIDKQAGDEDVQTAAAEVEKYVAENPAAREQLGRIAHTVVHSGKLSNYGTEAARKILRQWAEKYGKETNKNDSDRKP